MKILLISPRQRKDLKSLYTSKETAFLFLSLLGNGQLLRFE